MVTIASIVTDPAFVSTAVQAVYAVWVHLSAIIDGLHFAGAVLNIAVALRALRQRRKQRKQ